MGFFLSKILKKLGLYFFKKTHIIKIRDFISGKGVEDEKKRFYPDGAFGGHGYPCYSLCHSGFSLQGLCEKGRSFSP